MKKLQQIQIQFPQDEIKEILFGENQSCGFRSDRVAHASHHSTDIYPDPKAKLPAEGEEAAEKREP